MMNSKLSFFRLTVFVFISACSTTQNYKPVNGKHSPPEGKVLQYLRSLSPEDLEKSSVDSLSEKWWRLYKTAANYSTLSTEKNKDKTQNTIKACSYWNELSLEKDFPLRDLVMLKRAQFCPESAMPNLLETEKNWYQDLVVEVLWQQAQKSASLEDDITAALEKAKIETQFKAKEQWLKQAVQLAKKQDDKEFIQDAESALYRSSPRLSPPSKWDDLHIVAGNFRLWREFDQAITLYKKNFRNPKSTLEEKYQALKSIAQTYKSAQRKEEFLQATQTLSQWTKNLWHKDKKNLTKSKWYLDSQVWYARALWTENQTESAIKKLQVLLKPLKGLQPLDEVLWILGRIQEEKKDFEKSKRFFEQALIENKTNSNFRNKIQWNLAWLYYKNEAYPESAKVLLELKDSLQDVTDRARVLYWLGRTELKLARPAEAREAFETLQKEDPLGFYGILAAREMNSSLNPLSVEITKKAEISLEKISTLDPSLAQKTEWLLSLEENKFAELALNSLKNNIQQENDWLIFFSAYARAGLYMPLFSSLTSLKSEIRESLLSHHPDLLFPQPYFTEVNQASQKIQIPTELIYSIMRQESAFNPKVRSPAEAYGLMQLLPSVAKPLAKKWKVPFAEATDLFEPEINIPLGAAELQRLLDKYKQQYILAIANYNANETAINKWLQVRFRLDPIEFIEEIPYDETRTYVKLVLRNYIFYMRLQAKEPFAFPEHTLKLSSKIKFVSN